MMVWVLVLWSIGCCRWWLFHDIDDFSVKTNILSYRKCWQRKPNYFPLICWNIQNKAYLTKFTALLYMWCQIKFMFISMWLSNNIIGYNWLSLLCKMLFLKDDAWWIGSIVQQLSLSQIIILCYLFKKSYKSPCPA